MCLYVFAEKLQSIYESNHKNLNCIAMGHQNARNLIYSESLDKIESSKK